MKETPESGSEPYRDTDLAETRAAVPGRTSLPHIPDVELIREIGRGGMGIVYQGRQTFLERVVAVKLVMTQDMAARKDYIARFHREARILAGLSHPNIVACYQAGELTDGDCFIVMEFVEGMNLSSWIQTHGPLEARHAVAMVRDLASALDYARDAGVIHRDVKPENVLLKPVSKSGIAEDFPQQAKLTDLGLARPEHSTATEGMKLTVEGMIVGTPATMAPEQFNDPEGVDYRADIYGLGCVLYQALTGALAFPQRKLTELVQAKISPPPPDPREELRTLPASVSAVVAEMLAPRREDRFSDYADLVRRCDEILRKLPKAGSGASKTVKVRGAAGMPTALGSHVWKVVAAVAVVGLLVVVAVIGFGGDGDSPPDDAGETARGESGSVSQGDGGSATADVSTPVEVSTPGPDPPVEPTDVPSTNPSPTEPAETKPVDTGPAEVVVDPPSPVEPDPKPEPEPEPPPPPQGPQALFADSLAERLGESWAVSGKWVAEEDALGIIVMAKKEEAELVHPIAGGAWELTGSMALIHFDFLEGGKRTERASLEIGLADGGHVLLDLYELAEDTLYFGTFVTEREEDGAWKAEPTLREFQHVADGGDRTYVRFRLTARGNQLAVEVVGPRRDVEPGAFSDQERIFKPIELSAAATELRLRVLKGHASFRDVTFEVLPE